MQIQKKLSKSYYICRALKLIITNIDYYMKKGIKSRLIAMNFLQYAVWGAYLTSMGSYLGNAGLGANIGLFYAMQGIVSIFMPAIIGIIADKFLPAQKVLSICHGLAGAFMLAAGFYGMQAAGHVSFPTLFTLYSFSVAFYMPTIALSNSVAYSVLENSGYDTVKDFPPIRVFGTVGFICAMLFVNFVSIKGIQFQHSYNQFITSGVLGVVLCIYALTLPDCPCKKNAGSTSLVDIFGLRAFTLFKKKDMAVFFIFSMLLGVSLQITNGFANPFITHFSGVPEFADEFFSENANFLISFSQLSETLCILLIPFCMKKFKIKGVMLIAMFCWVLRFGFFGIGDTGFPGVIWLFLSCLVYGMAFDFFNISGSLYVNMKTDESIRSSAQGLFMLMTNGIGATVGTLSAQAVINAFTHYETIGEASYLMGNTESSWSTVWLIFAGYALVVSILFMILFKNPEEDTAK